MYGWNSSKKTIETARRENRIKKFVVAVPVRVITVVVVGEIKLGSRIIKRNKKDIAIAVSSVERIVVDVIGCWRVCFDSIGDTISCSIIAKALDFVSIAAATSFDKHTIIVLRSVKMRNPDVMHVDFVVTEHQRSYSLYSWS